MPPTFYLFEDGSAGLSLSPTENYFLSPTGAVVLIEIDKTRLRFLTCALPQMYQETILELLEFRNRHVSENVYITDTLGNRVDYLMERNTLLERVTWDLVPAKLESGAITSIDRYVEISMDPHYQSFQVTFPYLVYDPDQAVASYKYTLITQRHPTLNPPRFWIYPLLSLIHNQNESSGKQDPHSSLKSELTDHLSLLSKTLSISNYSKINPSVITNSISEYDVIIGPTHLTTKIPSPNLKTYSPSHSLNVTFKSPDISSLVHLPPCTVVQKYWGVLHANLDIIILDDLVLSTDFVFVKVFRAQVEEMYILQGLNNIPGVEDINQILSFALGIYQNRSSRKKVVAKEMNPVQSFKVKCKVDIPSLGEFTVYTDGRCKCHFADGTVAEFDGELVCVLDRNGERLVVRRINPVGYEWYVDAMNQFEEWVDRRASFDPLNRSRLREKIKERKVEIDKALNNLQILLDV